MAEVADLLNRHWQHVENSTWFNGWQVRTLSALRRCRTAALGGHKTVCTDCGEIRISYNSCRNRHCPKCQGKEREKWLEKRKTDLLPVQYFHVVFTLPDSLNTLAMHKPKLVYDALFEAAWQTCATFAKDKKHLGATTGMIAILHTWGQVLTLHPHLHCMVPQGGLTQAKTWKTARSKGKYLFPVKAMSRVFRGKYVAILKSKIPTLDSQLVHALYKKEWVVYAKRPFGKPEYVLEYLGRYTHKIAISNNRIQDISENSITFSYKDYRQDCAKKEMTLEAMEFIRRFAMHILPKGFVRIRHYGILSSTSKKVTIPIIQEIFRCPVVKTEEPRTVLPFSITYCPHCKRESRIILEVIPSRGPPKKC